MVAAVPRALLTAFARATRCLCLEGVYMMADATEAFRRRLLRVSANTRRRDGGA